MSDKPTLSPNPAVDLSTATITYSGPKVENGAYSAFVRRIIRAHARRVADGDIEGLAEMAALLGEVERAMQTAIDGLRSEPWSYSWTDVGRALGVTRQAARQRWARPTGQ